MLLWVPALPNLFVYLLFISLIASVFKAKLIKINAISVTKAHLSHHSLPKKFL